jgi:hypothetical protein
MLELVIQKILKCDHDHGPEGDHAGLVKTALVEIEGTLWAWEVCEAWLKKHAREEVPETDSEPKPFPPALPDVRTAALVPAARTPAPPGPGLAAESRVKAKPPSGEFKKIPKGAPHACPVCPDDWTSISASGLRQHIIGNVHKMSMADAFGVRCFLCGEEKENLGIHVRKAHDMDLGHAFMSAQQSGDPHGVLDALKARHGAKG